MPDGSARLGPVKVRLREKTAWWGAQRHDRVFENILEGVARGRVLFDEAGEAIDCVYLDVNPAFERLTGSGGVTGRKLSELSPPTLVDSPELLERCGRVARSGDPERSSSSSSSRWASGCTSLPSARARARS